NKAPVIMATEDSAAVPHTQLEIGTSTEIDARLMAQMAIHDGDAPQGPRIELRGWLTLSGVHARLRVRAPGLAGEADARERTKLIPLVSAGRTVPAMPGPSHLHIPA